MADNMTGSAVALSAETIPIKPILVNGAYNKAYVYAKSLDAACENKIARYLNHPAFADTTVRIMPDVHLGKATVIGWTATYTNLLIPSIIGLDIGCGVCACNLGKGNLRFDKLDAFIRKNIPSGQSVRSSLHESFDEMNLFASQGNGGGDLSDAGRFKNEIRKLCEKQGKSPERIFASLGTLGRGNHFIEIDVDEAHNRWLLIHSGSRILGAHTAECHEIIALRETEADSPIKRLSGAFADDYLADMRIVQHYARVNRALMAHTIASGFFKVDIRETECRDCVHNYIDMETKTVRKGAISAKKGEPVVIPFSMSEGAVLGCGKGNVDWNCSAPHGAGRKKARTDARGLSLDEYRKEMRGIWSSVICKDTLEESPMAYKKARDVLDYIGDTVDVERRLKPLYNFKAVD
ncbi:MAG: RtcB family protein [Treponema sp.]|jgi:RNA-splicing ligase RtcB|nr:RtcB family protein [Treponema sp.]